MLCDAVSLIRSFGWDIKGKLKIMSLEIDRGEMVSRETFLLPSPLRLRASWRLDGVDFQSKPIVYIILYYEHSFIIF